MNKNLNKRGASKKKGAAESDYLSEAGDVAAETAQQNEGAPPRKKGAAQSLVGQKAKNDLTITHDPEHKDLSALGRWADNQTRDFAGSDDTWPGDHLQHVARYGGKSGSVNKQGETKIGANFFPPEKKISTPTVQTGYVWNSSGYGGGPKGDGDTIFNDANQDGTMLGRGIQKAAKWLGATQKMGFTQNFGAARQNSYAKGAAKVNSIMNYGGAAKADYDKDMAEERIQITDDKKKIYQDDKEKRDS